MKKSDTQRRRVYAAERTVFPMMRRTQVDDLGHWRAYVDKIAGSAWWKRRSIIRSVLIHPKHSGSATARHFWNTETTLYITVDGGGLSPAGGLIRLPGWAMNQWVVIHEMAHILAPDGERHGRLFCRAYLALVDRQLGKDQGDLLRKSFKAHRVKYSKPHSIDATRRAELEARGAALGKKYLGNLKNQR